MTGATAGTFNNEIDMIDPDFKYPSILRGNIGGDTQLPGGMVGAVDFVWSKTMEDIKYQNLNLVQLSGVTGVGGRPFFARNRVSTVSDAILLENTSEGYNWNVSFEARRPFRNGFFASGSYAYGVARRAIMDGTSDQAASNWGNVYIPATRTTRRWSGRISIRATASRYPVRTTCRWAASSRRRSRCSIPHSRAVRTR